MSIKDLSLDELIVLKKKYIKAKDIEKATYIYYRILYKKAGESYDCYCKKHELILNGCQCGGD